MDAARAEPGYDPSFLGVEVSLPSPGARIVRVLGYTHFTVLLEPQRRLALATGVNIAGAELRDIARADDWHLDPRIGAGEQAGPDVYERNDLDRGHLVRRSDPVWGEPAVAARADVDTFAYPNAAPQVARFNQSRELWLGLEDHVLTYADAHDVRVSVFTAPVLAADDPVYRGIGVPRLFWKIAAWVTSGGLAAAGFVLDQSAQLDDLDLVTEKALLAGDPPPLGPYRTYQVPVADIAVLTGLELGPLPAADRLAAASSVEPGPRGRWVELADRAAIRL